MRVKVLLFGAFREVAGTDEIITDLREPAVAGDVWNSMADRFPALGRFERSALLAVNEEHASRDTRLKEGDTVAIFPPVSGGCSMNQDIYEITREPIDKAGLEERLLTGAAGAVVTFDGVVRNQTKGRPVVSLEYEAYAPMAVREMQKVGEEIRRRWPEIERIGIIHRFGELKISESSVVIVVTSPHRRVAFEACHFAIDRLKQTVPIWKKEIFEDGEAWVEGQKPAP